MLGQHLGEDEAGLRQRTFRGIDQEERPVHHLEGALDLAAEVRVPRRIDDVDLVALVRDRGVLGQDGDPALALEIDRVHDPVGHHLALAEDAALLEHGIDEGGLAVVDVGHDRDIADEGRGENLIHAPECSDDGQGRAIP